jgi:predicted  nucleic acid-binding Zn ribbon protein
MEHFVIKEYSKYNLKKKRDQLLKKGWKMQNKTKTVFQGSKAYYCQTMIRSKDYAETKI